MPKICDIMKKREELKAKLKALREDSNRLILQIKNIEFELNQLNQDLEHHD